MHFDKEQREIQTLGGPSEMELSWIICERLDIHLFHCGCFLCNTCLEVLVTTNDLDPYNMSGDARKPVFGVSDQV